MRQTTWTVTLGLALTAFGTCAIAADSAPAPADLSAEQVAAHFQDEAGSQREGELQAAARTASEPLDVATAKLSLANYRLAFPTAGPATRVLLGLATEADMRRLSDSAAAAQKGLDGVGKLLDDAPPGDQRRDLRQALVALTAFARTMAAISKEDLAGCSDAAVDLASVRESDNPEVAAAALLWQSYAWQCAGRRERALATLPPGLEKPVQPSYDFIARLLRCRILSDAGENTAALAMTIRMAAVADRWFPRTGDQTLQPRIRLLALMQTVIGQRWLTAAKVESLEGETAAKFRKVLDDARARLSADSKPQPVYQLETAVPILVQPPKPATKPADTGRDANTASQPTTGPVSTTAPSFK